MIRERRFRPTTAALVIVTVAVLALAMVLVVSAGTPESGGGPEGASRFSRSGVASPDGTGRPEQTQEALVADATSTDTDGEPPAGHAGPGASDHMDATGGSGLVDAVCSGETTITDMGPLGSDEIDEASGLAASHKNPGIWWTHNDSGGRPEIYGLDEAGELVAVVRLVGAEAHDWEDIATTTDASGRETIYIGDIGDGIRGTAARDHVTVYSIDAPRITPVPGEVIRIDADATATHIRYPDGPRDAEALIADHHDGALYLIDKDWSINGRSTLYRIDLSELSPAGVDAGQRRPVVAGPVVADRVADLDLPRFTLITAADASVDGSAVALRGYGFEALYHRGVGESVIDALSGPRCRGPHLDEKQGEAIAFASDSGSYVTVAEGKGAMLHRVSPADGI